jgi:hypothetical protein
MKQWATTLCLLAIFSLCMLQILLLLRWRWRWRGVAYVSNSTESKRKKGDNNGCTQRLCCWERESWPKIDSTEGKYQLLFRHNEVMYIGNAQCNDFPFFFLELFASTVRWRLFCSAVKRWSVVSFWSDRIGRRRYEGQFLSVLKPQALTVVHNSGHYNNNRRTLQYRIIFIFIFVNFI